MGSGEFIRVRMTVRGRVQGVGFRRFVYKQALQFPVGGWVRNNSDGSVEIEAVGASQVIAGFVAEIQKGSFLARVDEIEETRRETCSEGQLQPFAIRN